MATIPDGNGWTRGSERPVNEGPYEVEHMGRMILVRAVRSASGEMKIYGVPGHTEEGLSWRDFNYYRHPRHVVGRRSEASNLSSYDRALSRFIAGLAALRAAIEGLDPENQECLISHYPEMKRSKLATQNLVFSESSEDQDGVERAVKERLDIWYREDHSAIPLPSNGLAAPVEGEDINGQRTRIC